MVQPGDSNENPRVELSEPIRRLIELNLNGGNIPEGLRAAAKEYSSKATRRALLQLAELVEAGGLPRGYSATDVETIVAAAAVDWETLNYGNGGDESEQTPADHSIMLAPRLANWSEQNRSVQKAIRLIESHLWLAVLLLFLGGLTNWLMYFLTQEPFLEIVEEFELSLSDSTLMFFTILRWVGPVVMSIAGAYATILIAYRIGLLPELTERAIYSLPFFGKSLRRLHLSLMCDGISRHLQSGMGFSQALRGAEVMVDSVLLRDWLKKASHVIDQGGPLLSAVKYLPLQGEVLPALIGPVGPQPDKPAVGWKMAGEYFRTSGIRGAGSVRFVVPLFSILATSLGWMGMTGIFVPLISLISSLGGM